jgi:hypothetical protein
MANEWIKMRCDLSDDPSVILMMSVLGLDVHSVIGRLHKLWSWANRHLRDGYARCVTTNWIDVHVECAGFADAMKLAGWLTVKKDMLFFPNFDRHNGKSAKNRALSADRMSRSRYAGSVTKAQPEKRREEKSNTPLIPQGGKRKRLSHVEKAEAAAERMAKDGARDE